MPSALDLWLIAALGFLGSFGHCVGMCGPITAAFALSVDATDVKQGPQQHAIASSLSFHLRLNLGRLLSYALVGAAIGALSSVLFAGGQMAGVGSALRRAISMTTGLLLIWFGLSQAKPGLLPTLPLVHSERLHTWVNRWMMQLSGKQFTEASANRLATVQMLKPLLLGLLWGLIPCGFLYAGQLRAAETQSWVGGAAVMLAFGAGTMPAMLATGITTALLSSHQRSQLFQIGGWLSVIIGSLLLVRTGDTMSDYSGHAALVCLVLALMARPVSKVWAGPLRYRRLLGVGAFVLSCLHVLHSVSHTWKWNMQAIAFMLPSHRIGVGLGIGAIALMLPAALTSFDRAQKALGNHWRKLHLLSAPAFLLVAAHTVLVGSHYWGSLAITWQHQARVLGLLAVIGAVFCVRSPHVWSLLSLAQYYAPPKSSSLARPAADPCCRADP